MTTEDWSWDDAEKCYSYSWDFTNDEGIHSHPKEGFYSAEVTVKKRSYTDAEAFTEFGVCNHVEITLEFNRDVPLYSLGESVEIMCYVTDENGFGVDAGLESALYLPDGTDTQLTWTFEDSGMYSASYTPEQEGEYHLTVGVREGAACYIEQSLIWGRN